MGNLNNDCPRRMRVCWGGGDSKEMKGWGCPGDESPVKMVLHSSCYHKCIPAEELKSFSGDALVLSVIIMVNVSQVMFFPAWLSVKRGLGGGGSCGAGSSCL